MIDTIRRFIEQEKLLSPTAHIVVGLSGGMDSMVLLDLLLRLGYTCVAAHCNFHLRGEESLRDARFVERWCQRHDIPLTTVDFNTRHYAAEKKISIEMAARELRYSWFEEIRTEYGAEAVAVAHHRDDTVETLLLNLIRGTGIRGLTGISPKKGSVVRPLLCVTHDEIADYVATREIPYVIDSTNEEDLYLRNAIRLNIIPALERLNPAVREAIYRTSQNMRESEKLYNASVEQTIAQLYDGQRIDIGQLLRSASPRSVLFEILTPLGFTPSTIADIMASVGATPGKRFFSEEYRLVKDRHFFIIDRMTGRDDQEHALMIDHDTREITDPLQLTFEHGRMPMEISRQRCDLYVDYELLQFPLQLRRWRQGDWFIPFGMRGRKKVSDYFTDRKFSLREKEDVWLLLSGDDVIWIVGERPDNRYRVTDKTSHIYRITLRGCD